MEVPDNVRIILEVDSLEQATPATVSRCGMVWFSAETLTLEMRLQALIKAIRRPLHELFTGTVEVPATQLSFVEAIQSFMISENPRASSLIEDALDFAMAATHIMPPTRERLLRTLKVLLVQGVDIALEYDDNHPDFPMSEDKIKCFAKRWLMHSLIWSFTGSASWHVRSKFSDLLVRTSGLTLPEDNAHISDFRVRVEDGRLEPWSEGVPRMEIESHKVTSTDIVVPTTDTLRHTDVVRAWLTSRTPFILCGPPGMFEFF